MCNHAKHLVQLMKHNNFKKNVTHIKHFIKVNLQTHHLG